MRYLVDTQILIWAMICPEKLSISIQYVMQSQAICVSPISLFEIAIKQKIGKLPEFTLPVVELCKRMENDGFKLLELQIQHINVYDNIPLYPEHRDPFDRLLLATAYSENIPFISTDGNFDLYADLVKIVRNI
jgi:PIN domain nuclease of toxin-antitoxin system